MTHEKTGNSERTVWCLEARDFGAAAAMIFFALSAVGILVYRWGFWKNTDTATVWTQVIVPWISTALFIMLLPAAGKKAFWTTAIPFALGCVFFVTKAANDMNIWKAVLSIMVYVLALALYCGTVFGFIRTKFPLILLLTLEFLYHLLLADIGIGKIKGVYVPRTALYGWKGWALETAVMCIIIGLILMVLSMKKKMQKPAHPAQSLNGAYQ